MRLFVLGICCLFVNSCREIQPVTPSVTISGYQITGTVISSNGTVLDSVAVKLSYDYQLFGNVKTDTQTVYVSDPAKIVDVSVYNSKNIFVRNLYFGTHSVGVVPRAFWNELDDHGQLVPSGKYNIRYIIDGTIIKQSPVIIDGNLTTITNSSGNFTITNDYLPVGEIFDYYDSVGVYQITRQVQPYIILEFTKFNLSGTYAVYVRDNQIINAEFIIR